MPNRSTTIGQLCRRESSRWIAKRRVQNALQKAEGNVRAAGRLLDLSPKQVRRYVMLFALGKALEETRTATGWHRPAARQGTKRTRWLKRQARAA